MSQRVVGERVCFFGSANNRAEPPNVIDDSFDRAMVAYPNFHAGFDQITRDVGLDIGKSYDEIGLELEDFLDLRARERRYFRFFLACSRRPNGESRNADDA